MILAPGGKTVKSPPTPGIAGEGKVLGNVNGVLPVTPYRYSKAPPVFVICIIESVGSAPGQKLASGVILLILILPGVVAVNTIVPLKIPSPLSGIIGQVVTMTSSVPLSTGNDVTLTTTGAIPEHVIVTVPENVPAKGSMLMALHVCGNPTVPEIVPIASYVQPVIGSVANPLIGTAVIVILAYRTTLGLSGISIVTVEVLVVAFTIP